MLNLILTGLELLPDHAFILRKRYSGNYKNEGRLDNKPYDTGKEEQSHTMNQLNIFVFQSSFILVSTLAIAELHTEQLNK